MRNLGFACRNLGFSPDYGFSLVGLGFSDFWGGGGNPLTDPPITGSGGANTRHRLSPASGQPVLGPDRMVFAGGSGTDFLWKTLIRIKLKF